MKRLVFLLCLGTFVTGLLDAIEPPRQIDFDSVRDIPILEGGRHKPLDTFAGETLREITGRWNFKKTDPLAYLFAIMTRKTGIGNPRADRLPSSQGNTGRGFFGEASIHAEISSNRIFRNGYPAYLKRSSERKNSIGWRTKSRRCITN
jgi:hypothetical protein